MNHASAPHYDGPLSASNARTRFSHVAYDESDFTREGPRADSEYRDLGLDQATSGAIGAKHIRAVTPFEKETGWHWHDMSGHFVYVLKGWISFKYAGMDEVVTVQPGGCLSQPAGVAHNVVARSDDLELIEINLPAQFGTFDLPARQVELDTGKGT